MIKNFTNYVPVKVVFGAGKLDEAGSHVKQYGKKALIVTTGPSLREEKRLLIDRICKILLDSGVESEVFCEVSQNPLSTQVDKGAEFGKEKGCDVVIGLGGGSAIDAAKGIAISMGHNASIWNFCKSVNPEGVDITDSTLPIIVITTTSGSGSHITPFTVITIPGTGQKPGNGSDYMYPRVSIVDPELMLSMPERVTAITGFDVLSHAIEAYTSNDASPITDIFAEEAMRLTGRYLRRAVENGNDLEARSSMALADTLAGHAISMAVITLCHSISHAVGGICDTVHGETLAALTPHTMRFSMDFRPEKYKKIGMLLRDEHYNDGRCCQLEDSILEVEKLLRDIRLDRPLSKQGVKEGDLEEIAVQTLKYMGGTAALDPRKADTDDIVQILKKAF